MLTLASLMSSVDGARLVRGSADVQVTGITNDTRRLQPGEIFVAIPGLKRDGLDLAPVAVANGASAIVSQREPALDPGVPVVLVPDPRAALGDLSAAFYGHPTFTLPAVGITGTDGKTSTTHLLSAVLEAHGLRTGWLSTVNTKIGDHIRDNAADHTTPESPLVQAALAEMRDADLDVAIVETSSHALELERVRGTRFRVGVFTNLSPEHINFHGSFEAYREAKSRLFRRLPEDGLAVLNADDPASRFMADVTGARVLWYGLDNDADIRGRDVRLGPDGTSFRVEAGGTSTTLTTRLVGRFNVANWLAAFGAASFFGATLDDLRRAVERQDPVPGRMNLINVGQRFPVLVDFAHTPQALEKALDTVRSLVPGRVHLVFGLAGGRDSHNRPVMGELAARKADSFVISMDDPYDEDPLQIAEQIAEGARVAGAEGRFTIDIDRRSAIRRVLRAAQPGDAVLLAGKGHERRMAVGAEKLPWNDAEVAREELSAL